MNDLDEYQKAASRTEGTFPLWADRVKCHALGVAGEAGEVANQAKKYFYHEDPEARNKMEDELGDTLWYVALLAAALGIPLSVLAERNLGKLRARYPNGFKPTPQPWHQSKPGPHENTKTPADMKAPGPGLELLRSLDPDDGDAGDVLPQFPLEPAGGFARDVTGHTDLGACRCPRCR